MQRTTPQLCPAGSVNYVAVSEALSLSPSARMAGLAADDLVSLVERPTWNMLHLGSRSRGSRAPGQPLALLPSLTGSVSATLPTDCFCLLPHAVCTGEKGASRRTLLSIL